MRPGRKGPRKVAAAGESLPGLAGFNEAGAQRPQKGVDLGSVTLAEAALQ